ncbi:polysaccharide deacetylase family protein [Taibaiella chishuiensis]|uniref:Peptidoglycan/xylan/chitin deacetylase (PgdA/CDA1 family) n=1 Tax=Taibaiella chishuiensis TaxID=1434707 RepID=A0A2P8DAZ4_9BACT|nr:polysaccharide deacetylase family protein [Taibaiella chishuiensis]PSK94394.1 peptidoglycan/xylan/chitin deacetylase (PgdA/CDA1 family) [Taibaiella chishuiensis]
MYLLQTPKLLRALSPSFAEWEMPVAASEPAVYLTFDDGPHPVATPFALEQLARYEAQATFFCVGKNVVEYPDLYDQVLAAGHSTGNHTHNHLKGWRTNTKAYIEDTMTASRFINSKLFRPPYGRIKRMQAVRLHEAGYRLIMWSLLSGDFDTGLSPQRCLENVVFNLKPGHIVVLHDSTKAWDRMSYVLPRILEHCKKNRWALKGL